MKFLHKVISFVIIPVYLCPGEWINISPTFSQSYNYLITGTFIDRNEGWMIDWGQTKLFHTEDSGLTWEVWFDGIDTYFYDIVFTDRNNGWAKIYNGIPFEDPNIPSLWCTQDRGKSWQKVTTPSAFYRFTFLDSLTGFSGGETDFCRTIDGGVTWGNSTIEGDVRFGIWNIYFPDRQHGWAVGDNSDYLDCGIILNTVDSGKTWQAQLPITYPLRAVCFSHSKHGCAVGLSVFGGGIVLTTNDGGDNWQEVYLTCPWLNDVVFINDSTGWIVGDYGYIGYTEDGGQTWAQVESGTEADLNRIVFVENGKFGFIFGEQNTLLRYEVASDNVAEGEINDHPVNFKLYPNYPNPFNGETKIEYKIEETVDVSLRVYDLMGREVMILVNDRENLGNYKIVWNGKDQSGNEMSSGIYFYELKAGHFTQVRKMVFVR